MGVWTLVLYIVLVGLVVVPPVMVFGPYRWHSLGRFRQAYGPWLVNFDRRLTRRAVLRDLAISIAFWLTFALLMLIPNNSSLFWLTLTCTFLLIIGGAVLSDRLVGYMGSKGVTFFLAGQVSEEQVTEFLAEHGALIPGRHEDFAGRFSTEAGYVWVQFVSDQLKFDSGVLKRELRVEGWERRERIARILGDEPYTGLSFFLPRRNVTVANELAAMHIMALFALRWRCVLLTNHDQVFTGAEIQRMVEQGTPVLGVAKTEAKAVA